MSCISSRFCARILISFKDYDNHFKDQKFRALRVLVVYSLNNQAKVVIIIITLTFSDRLGLQTFPRSSAAVKTSRVTKQNLYSSQPSTAINPNSNSINPALGRRSVRILLKSPFLINIRTDLFDVGSAMFLGGVCSITFLSFLFLEGHVGGRLKLLLVMLECIGRCIR